MTQTSQFINSFSFPNTSPLSLDSSNLSDLLGTKQKKADLGPIWSEDELKIFLKYFKQSGLKEIESMQAELQEAGYKRTVNNLLAIYLKNRNFLNYNPACTAKDLYAIMADRYQNIEESVIPTFSEAPALRKLKSVTSDTKTEGKSTISKDMDSFEDSLRVKNDGLTLKKKSTSVKRNGPPVDESLFNSSYKPKRIHTSNSVIPRERVKKQRKSTATRGKFPVNYDLHDEDLFKNIEVGCRACGGKSKKSYHYFEAKNNKNNKDFSAPFLKFVNNEILYSPIDAPYFESNDFQRLFGNNEQTDLNLTRDEWSILRSCMGKPRRFSNKFISEEREKLQNYRKVVRNYLYEGVSLQEKKLQPITTQKIKALKPLQVSQIVLAVHPNCQHIHPGSILTITGDSVIIKFLPTDLGAVSVSDSNVVPISQEEAAQILRHFDRNNTSLAPIPMNRSWSEPDGDRSPLEKKVVEDIDLNAFSMIIKMLEKKTALVSELRKYNNLAENDPESLNEKLKQEFGWTGAQTKLLDNALKNILTKSRLRGANNYDTEFISENLDNLLQKPLRNMLDASKRQGQDEKEMNAINEIKSLLNKNVEEKISGQIKALTEKFNDVHLNSQCESRTTRSMDENEEKNEKDFEEKHRVGQDISTCERSDDKDTQEVVEKIMQVDDQKENLKSRIVDDCSSGEKKDKLKMLANNMIGVLFSLKYQGDLSMKDNKYLTELHTEIFEENAEEFHEINTVLLNVCTR